MAEVEKAQRNMDCDVCTPECHVGCQPQPYNGAAPMGRGAHFRCSEHRTPPVKEADDV